MGLPEEVADLLGQVYGGQRDEPSHVQCQYETGAGLGEPFANRMGRLMGCPISPDSAKILLNSVLMAIQSAVQGVRLWPFSGEEVSQLAFADDWVGVFEDEGQLRKALEIWLAWAEVVGARLGIKGLVKTVVSGADHSSGRARSPPDPGLQDLEGRRIPMLACDELYKHLGVPRSANADGWRSWVGGKGVQGVRDKLRAGITRLRQLKAGSTSIEQFMCISNVLLGGMGGFYLQSSVASMNELEQIEREWRRCFNRFARRDPSSSALSLYKSAACWSKGRTHLARTGMAALYAAVEKTLADTEESPARQAVRSAVALSLHQWGCRSEPNRWQWNHLRDELRRAVSRKGARYIGDAWMHACLMYEDACLPSKVRTDRAEALRARKWGRWRGLTGGGTLGTNNPLTAGGAWWQGDSRLLFEPRERRGLGLNVRHLLLQAGVVELSQLCSNPILGSGLEGRWQEDRKAAEGRVGVRITPAMWKQWLDAIRVLKGRGVKPVAPCSTPTQRWRQIPHQPRPRADRRRIERAARWLRLRRLEGGGAASSGVHAALLREAFQPRQGTGALGRQAPGPRQVCRPTGGWRLDKAATEHFEDWEGQALEKDLPLSRCTMWAATAAQWRSQVLFRDGDGWPIRADTKAEMEQEVISALPPALQLAVRARIMLGKEATVVKRGHGEKLHGVRVAEDVQRDNWDQVCELQARMEFTHAFATDASEGELPLVKDEEFLDDWGWPRRRTSAAVVAHDGSVEGGCLPEDLPSDSYLGELSALVVALKGLQKGARVLIVADSTSPIRAWLKFRRKGNRAQRQYREASVMQLFEEQAREMSLVYFLWQRSHCGSPMNEMADREAERLRLEGARWVDVEAFSGELAGQWPARVNGGLFAWALRAGTGAVHNRLNNCEHRLVDKEDDDWEVGLLQGEVGAAAALMREEKLMIADAGQGHGRRVRMEAARMCIHGCKEGGGTWYHYLFRCQQPDLCDARKLWAKWVYRCRPIFDPLCLHDQVTALLSFLPGPYRRSADSLRDERGDRKAAHRLLCGFVSKGPAGGGESGMVQATVKELIVRGLKVLCLAAKKETELRMRVEERIRDLGLLSKVMKAWLRVVLRGNPLRVAALRQLRIINASAAEVGRACTEAESMAEGTQDWLLKMVRRRTKAAREEADVYFPDLGDEAVLWWFLQSCTWKWWALKGEGFVKYMAWQALTPSAEAAINLLQRWDERSTRVWCKWVKKEDTANACPRVDRGSITTARAGTAQVIDVELRHAWACRAFHRLGGHRALRKTTRSMCKARDAHRWEVMRRSLENFRQSGSCSGRTPKRYTEEEKIVVIIGKRTKTNKTDKAWEAGSKADNRGRWAVDAILEARKRANRRGWEFLVAWTGGHEPSWVRAGDLDRSLKEEARAAIEAVQGPQVAARALRKAEREQERARRQEEGGRERKRPRLRERSRRLAEAEERKRKLETALIVRPEEAVTKRSKRKKTGSFGVVRVWGLHVLDGEPRVHVEWECPEAGDAEVIPVSWLSDDLQAQVASLATEPRNEGPSSATIHPFFAR